MSVASTTTGQVRGGGRLYDAPPLDGYTEEEMVAEAQVREYVAATADIKPRRLLPFRLTNCRRSNLDPLHFFFFCLQVRHTHNMQRRRLRQLLSAASEDGTSVATRDLLMAAKLANLVRGPPHAAVNARCTAPRDPMINRHRPLLPMKHDRFKYDRFSLRP